MELTQEGAPAKKRRLNELETSDIQFTSTSTAGQVEKKEGLSKTQHGVSYQIKLLMLFFCRGEEQGYSYELETELTNSGKLDDVVFKYDKKKDKIEDGVRYLQAKHSKDTTKTIQFDDLLKRNDKLFGLSKYYLSFLKIVQSLKSKGKSTEFIKQITLCTNIKFHTNLEECMDNTSIVTIDEDDILYGNIVLNRYKFKTKDAVLEKSVTVGQKADEVVVKTEFPRKNAIVQNLSNVTVMDALANILVKDLSKGSIPFKSMYQTYHGWLVKHIFELPDEFLEPENVPKYYVKFRKTFIEMKDGELKEFRDHLLKAMAAVNNQSILDSWRVIKLQTGKKFCCKAKNNVTPKDFNKLAKALANSLSENKKLTMEQLYASSHGWLLNNVFYIPRHHIKISEDFLNNKSDDKDVVAFRQLIEVYLEKIKEGPKTLTEFRGKTIFVTKNFFRKPQSDCNPDNSVSNKLIETFLSKLVFVVTCDEDCLGKTVQKELGNKLNLIEDELIASDLEVKMFNFLKGKKNCVTQNTWHQFFQKIFGTISRYASMGTTEKRKMKIDEYKCEFKKQKNQKPEKQEEERTLDKIMNANKRMMIIYQKYPLLTEIKIHQAFGCKERDAYIVDTLKHSINDPNRGTILKAFSSEKRSHLIIINDDVKICDKRMQFFRDVIEILKKNTEKRFTLITVEKDEEICKMFQSFLKNYEEFVDNDTYLDLTVGTQNLLEKKKVVFQGREIALGMLITDDKLKRCVKGDILLKLITDTEKIIIGDAPVHQSNLDTFEEIEKCYIPRSLFRLIEINPNIQLDIEKFCITTNNKIESDVDKRDIVLITQDVDAKAFEELCAMYDTNIHWLINNIDDELRWQKSRGDISQLHKYKYINTYESEAMENNFCYQINDIMDLSENCVLVAADPGMGKSTLLTHLTSTISTLNQVSWVVRINLRDYQTDFSDFSKDNIDKRNALKFLYKVLKFEIHDKTGEKINIFDFATLKDDLICLDIVERPDINEFKKLEFEIFNKIFNENNVILLLDGFDEVEQTGPIIISWVAQIKNMAKIKKIWMTTRPYNIQSILESKLDVFSYQLTPITERSTEFVKNFWKTRLTQAQSNSLENKIETDDKFEVYVEELFETYFFTQSSSTFIGIPLHIRMIAEIYEKEFKEFYYSEDRYLTDEQKDKMIKHTLISLYDAFVTTKFNILHKDIKISLEKNKLMLKAHKKKVIEYHQILSLTDNIFDNSLLEGLISEQDIIESKTKFKNYDIGLIKVVGNETHFVHWTFRDYFTASFFVHMLNRSETVRHNIDKIKVLSLIKHCIISHDIIRYLNYYFIEKIDTDKRALLNGVLSQDLQVLENINLEGVHDSYGRTPLHLACTDRNLDILIFKHIFDMYPAALNSKDTLFGWTPLHYAIACHTMCHSLNDNDLKYMKESMKRSDVEYDINQKDTFGETLLMLSIQNVCKERCFYKLLTSFDNIDYEYEHHITAFDYCYKNFVDIYQFLDLNFFLEKADLCKSKIGKRMLKIFIETGEGSLDFNMRKILSFRGEEYTKEWIKVCVESDNKLIVKLLSEGLLVANLVLDIESKHIDVNFIDDQNNTALKIVVDEAILRKSIFHETSLEHIYLLLRAGAFYDDIENKFWENLWAKPNYFLGTVKHFFHYIENNKLGSTVFLLNRAVVAQCINKGAVVNIRDRKNCMTPLQFAASLGHKDIVICLLKHGAFYDMLDETRNLKTAEELTQNRDISNILAKTRNLFSAVKEGNIENVIKYLDCNVNYTDRKGKQPIHLAVENGNLEIINHLLNTDGIKPEPTLANNTVLHLAVKSGNNEILQTLLDSTDPNRLESIINLPDMYGRTALDIAIEQKNNTAIAALKSKNVETLFVLHSQ